MTHVARVSALFLVLLVTAVAPAQIVGKNGLKKGEWRPTDVPAGWKVTTAGRYQFQSNAAEATVKKVATHLNAMFKQYLEKFPTTRTPTKEFVVKIFKNREEFLAYGSPPSSAAYYSWVDKEMVGYDTGLVGGEITKAGTTGHKLPGIEEELEKADMMDLLGVIAHEGWHQYFHWYCASKVSFPSWCDEGIGDYFYTAHFVDGKMQVGGVNNARIRMIQWAIRKKKYIPLKDLVTFDQQKYYAVAGLAYAEGWALVDFFMENPEYKKQRFVTRFVQTFTEHHSIERATKEVFTKIDWEKIEADWKKHVMAMKAPEDEAMKKLAAMFGEDGADGGKDGGEVPAGAGEPTSKPAPASRPESRPEN